MAALLPIHNPNNLHTHFLGPRISEKITRRYSPFHTNLTISYIPHELFPKKGPTPDVKPDRSALAEHLVHRIDLDQNLAIKLHNDFKNHTEARIQGLVA